MSEIQRAFAAIAFQTYPALLFAVAMALFAPAGTAAATTLVLLLAVVGWTRSARHVWAAGPRAEPFAGA